MSVLHNIVHLLFGVAGIELRIGGLLDTKELLIDRTEGGRIPSFDDCAGSAI